MPVINLAQLVPRNALALKLDRRARKGRTVEVINSMDKKELKISKLESLSETCPEVEPRKTSLEGEAQNPSAKSGKLKELPTTCKVLRESLESLLMVLPQVQG